MADKKPLFTLDELQKTTGGELYTTPACSARDVHSVIIDSRQAVTGCLFVPLKGERTDGHLYVSEVFERGGRVSLVERAFWNEHAGTLKDYAARYHAAFVIVPHPLSAMQTLAEAFLRTRNVFRIGVTGSNGKTTTKEIIGSVLSLERPAFMNRGNFNSEIGLPLSVFEVESGHEYAVFEMGMNRKGEMDILADIVKPDAALITNIGTAHIGMIGSKEEIAKEKKKIFLALEPGRPGYAYEGDEFLDFLRRGVRGDIRTFGEKSTSGYEGAEDRGLDGYLLHWAGATLRFPLPGSHNLRNALAAISLCRGIGVSDESIRRGLEAVKPLFGRGQILRGSVTILQDCYNANPDSMTAAIEFLREVAWSGRKIAVLASMKELGEAGAAAHRAVGVEIAESGFDGIFLFGEEMRQAHEAVAEAGLGAKASLFTEFDELTGALGSFLRAGDLVLIKGSRSMELERVAEAIRRSRA